MVNKANRLKSLQSKKPTSSAVKILDTIKEKDSSNNKKSLSFSFLFFDRTHKYFNLGNTRDNWFLDLFDVLKALSDLTWKEITDQQYFSTYEPHGYTGSANININDYLKEYFFEDSEQLNCFQLRVGSKSDGRLHGFLVDNIYYLVWLDPNHNMYNSNGYEKARKTPPMKSEYTLVVEEKNKAIEDYQAIEKLFEEECGDSCPYISKK